MKWLIILVMVSGDTENLVNIIEYPDAPKFNKQEDCKLWLEVKRFPSSAHCWNVDKQTLVSVSNIEMVARDKK